jgi:plastocyanin
VTSPQTSSERSVASIFAVLVAVAALLVAVVAAVVSGNGESTTTAQTAAASATTVTLSDFKITPTMIMAGTALKIVNDGPSVHNFAIEGTSLKTADLQKGGTADLDVSSLDKAKTYTVACLIPGHKDAGMKAELMVGQSGGGETASGGTTATTMDYKAMDDAMNKTISAFPQASKGKGNVPLEPKILPDGTKEFELTTEITKWEKAPGEVVDAWTYNGIVPGPAIHVNVGDKVKVIVHNKLPMATDIHWHGIGTPNSQDGVAPLTQPEIKPGETYTYNFTPKRTMVGMYHAHHAGQEEIINGLFAAFYVGEVPLPSGTFGGIEVPAGIQPVQHFPMVLNDAGVIGLTLNAKSFPATEPVVVKNGDWVAVDYFNEGTMAHPMHLHQFPQLIYAKDGIPLDNPYWSDTINVAPGERYPVIFHADEVGAWVWHCHILPHVERETGAFGMMTAVIVK